MHKIFPPAGDGPTRAHRLFRRPPEGGIGLFRGIGSRLPATEIKNHMVADKQLQLVTTKVLPLHRPRHELNAYACSV
jgi:hypothetical protein